VVPRWTFRIVACATAFAIACAASTGESARTFKPNEVQMLEQGDQASWTYGPMDLKVSRGTTVTFVNRGKEFHTVTSDDPGRPFDISLDTNTTKTFTFDTVGTFAYHCGVHPQMKGVVHVCDGSCG
jgi:plastocyanin